MSRALVAGAVLLLALRLFTGIVYEWDDPTTYLVLKHVPAVFVTAHNTAERQVRDDFTVLMEDENALVGQDGYEWLMQWSPALAGCCIAAAAWLARRRRR